jgi:predicted amidohydrolase
MAGRRVIWCLSTAWLVLACALHAQPRFDLLLKGGHVIDPKNGIDRVMDVGISGGKIARVAAGIDSSDATQTVAVLRVDRGNFGFVDSAGARKSGNQSIVCEMTLRAGKVMWDLNGRASQDWKTFPYQKESWKR